MKPTNILTENRELADLYYCEKDDDCVAVPDGPCGCNSGGIDTSINKEHEGYWRMRQEVNLCPQVISCNSKSLCVNNRCEIQIKHFGYAE